MDLLRNKEWEEPTEPAATTLAYLNSHAEWLTDHVRNLRKIFLPDIDLKESGLPDALGSGGIGRREKTTPTQDVLPQAGFHPIVYQPFPRQPPPEERWPSPENSQ